MSNFASCSMPQPFKKSIFILAGTISLALGILGIIIPGLPATPFFLLTASLYVKSSPGLYNKLVQSSITGPYLRRFRNGISLRIRIFSVLLMWSMIILTLLFVVEGWVWTTGLMLLGTAGTLVKIFLPFRKKQQKPSLKP
jgi:uncharacterized protein